EELEDQPGVGAAGGIVRLASNPTSFQRDVWQLMIHPFGTGGPDYRKSEEPNETETVQSPVYRRSALVEAEGFREDIPWAEDDELHNRLQTLDWGIRINPGANLYYSPRKNWRSFMIQFHNYGQGRGSLASEGIFPVERHHRIDVALMLWTFGFVWNPVGWALALFYLAGVGLITIEECIQTGRGWRLLYLFPLAHSSYWIGWLKTRFRRYLP
ncbi:MAG: glycosyltransferase, partial [bacterium]